MTQTLELLGQDSGIGGEYTQFLGYHSVASHHGGGNLFVAQITKPMILNEEILKSIKSDLIGLDKYGLEGSETSGQIRGLYFPNKGRLFPDVDIEGEERFGQERYQACIDFSPVSFLSSSLLGNLITANRRLKIESGSTLYLSGMKSEIYELFTLTNLCKMFNIRESYEDVVRELND